MSKDSYNPNYKYEDQFIPPFPDFSESDLKEMERNEDWSPIAFEWYRYTSNLALTLSSVRQDTPRLRFISRRNYITLASLLSRCSRLMYANIALTHERKFAEASSIVDRSIFETAVKIRWLILESTTEKFDQLIASGLRTELALKKLIEKRIESNDGEMSALEERMLVSVENQIRVGQLDEKQIWGSKKLPSIESMMKSIGDSSLDYVVMQRIGSHHVHGTWSSLLTHYLQVDEKDEGEEIDLSYEEHAPNIFQYISIARYVLKAIEDYANFLFLDEQHREVLRNVFDIVITELNDLTQKCRTDNHSNPP